MDKKLEIKKTKIKLSNFQKVEKLETYFFINLT